ncbi:MAG: PfkB family carbohydrate kinase [Chloroflexota bacterium]
MDSAGYAAVAEQLANRFPRLVTIAFTQYGSICRRTRGRASPDLPDGFHVARSYRIAPIVDRVGAGDLFAAGLIYALLDGRPVSAAPRVAGRGGVAPQALDPRREPRVGRRGGCPRGRVRVRAVER